MSKRTAQTTRRVPRLAGVAGCVVATALCASFAWSVVGGALRPVDTALPSSIVIATAAAPISLPPLSSPRDPAPPIASVKSVAPQLKHSASRASSTEKNAVPQSQAALSAPKTAAAAQPAAANSLLRTESKTSRTRGQPGQN